jgi:hypothetical protein
LSRARSDRLVQSQQLAADLPEQYLIADPPLFVGCRPEWQIRVLFQNSVPGLRAITGGKDTRMIGFHPAIDPNLRMETE